jgi:FixJ family two-component response regulator
MKLLEKEQEAKGLSEAELLQVYNLAPQAVEILQNIVVDWEERFTAEEMEVVVKTVGEVFRCGERLPETETSSNGN